MLSSSFVSVAIALRLVANVGYITATWKGTVHPNPVTWLLWAITPFVAFAAQLQEGVGHQAWMTAATGVGPLLIFLVALVRHTSWRIGPFDVMCGVCAAAGIVLWQATADPAMAVLLSIVADALGGIPTVAKAYRTPASEKTYPYWITIASFSLTLLTVSTWTFTSCAFFVYAVLINLTVSGVVSIRSAQLGGASRGAALVPGRPASDHHTPSATLSVITRRLPGQAHVVVVPRRVRDLWPPAAPVHLYNGSTPGPSAPGTPDRAAFVSLPRAAAGDARIEVLEARVAELERMLALEPVPQPRPSERPMAAVAARDPWEGWDGSA